MLLMGWVSGGLTVYFEEEIEAFVFLFLQLSTSSGCSLWQSLRCTPAYWLDFLSYLTTDASLLTPLGLEGRWQWSPLVAILGTAQLVQSG